jgi:CheY-like chemotaxis protein/two-component sensor histidine kinase
MMDRQLGHMVHLIDDLLDVARISQGKLALRRDRVPLREVLDSAIESTRPIVETAGHELVLDLPGEAMEVDGDRTRLAQVIGNLLSNAAKYTPPGGRIALAAQREGGDVVIRVEDNGCGIAPEMLGRVFEMFVQGPEAAGRAQGGLGIGLSLARQLVELHGGLIGVASEGLGRGAVFQVRLPVADAAADVRAAPPARPPAVAAPERLQVLVVDDNIEAAATLATMLGLLGQDARAVHSGVSALSHVRQFGPSMVFCDLDMPGMDGCELARRLRHDPATSGLRLVAVSGWGSADDKLRASEAGFDAHLTKPVDLAALERIVAPGPGQ